MPTFDSQLTTDEILRDPRAFVQHARELRQEQADTYVTDEIRRRVGRLLPTKTDQIARALSFVTLVGAVITSILAVASVFVMR